MEYDNVCGKAYIIIIIHKRTIIIYIIIINYIYMCLHLYNFII